MSTSSPGAWMMSITLHALIIGLLALVSYTANLNDEKPPVIIELVAGPGDNYMATEAAALGDPAAVSFEMPKAAPWPVPPQPAPAPVPVVREVPIIPAPQPPKKEVIKPAPPKIKEPAKKPAPKKVEKEPPTMTKAEFDRMNAGKSKPAPAPRKSAPVKVAKLDTRGIRDGLLGVSAKNTKGGAGGTVMKSNNTDLLAAYDAHFKIMLRRAFEEERPPGLSDSLKVTIEVRSNADGSLTGARVATASGSPEFDRAVLDALRRMSLPPRPDKRAETVSFVFTMREN